MTPSQHIRTLAKAYGIKLDISRYLRDDNGWAYYNPKGIVVPPPSRSLIAYVVGLHEIAHIVLHKQRYPGWTPDSVIVREEIEAWRWSQRHAILPLDPSVYKTASKCIEGYCSRYPRYTRSKTTKLMVEQFRRRIDKELR